MVVVPVAAIWGLTVAFVISATVNVWAGFSFRKLGRQFKRLEHDHAADLDRLRDDHAAEMAAVRGNRSNAV